MAPKKKIIDKPPKSIKKRAQKPLKPSPKIVEVKIGSSVALALLQADSSRTSPQKPKRLAKQTTSLDNDKSPVKTRTSKMCVNQSSEKHSVHDSVAPEKQLHSSRVRTRKYVHKTIEVHCVDESETVQEEKKTIPKPKSSKTTKNHSVDKLVTPQKQLHRPLVTTRKYVKKTTQVHAVHDSKTVQKQKKKILTPKSSKTTKKHSVDKSVTQQEQLHSPLTKKYVNKTIEVHGVNNSETLQEQKKKIPTPKSSKTTKKHSVDKSVTPQEQLHSPLTKKYVNETIEVHGVNNSETGQEQKKKIPTPKSSKTTKKHSVDKSVTPQEQLHSPLTKKYGNKTKGVHNEEDSGTVQEHKKKRCVPESSETIDKHSIDKSVTPQKQSHSPLTKKYVDKSKGVHNEDDSSTVQEHKKKRCVPESSETIEKHSVDDSLIRQEQLNTPAAKKFVNKRIEVHIFNDLETVQKKRPGPKSKTLFEVVKKPATTGIKAQNESSREKQQTLVKSANISQEIGPHNSKNESNREKQQTFVKSANISQEIGPDNSKNESNREKQQTFVKSANISQEIGPDNSKNESSREKEQRFVKSANVSQEIGPDNYSDILRNGLAASEGYENVSATPIETPRGRPKGTTLNKSQILNAKEINNAAPMFEDVLENPSPPQSNNRPNSVSNTSNLTWAKDISTNSSISSDATSATVTSNDYVRFNKKLDQLVNSDQLKPKNDNLKQIYSSEISRSESSSSSSSDSSSSSSSSSSSDSELGGTNTIPELNLSTSSLTPKSFLSDTYLFRRKIENINKAVEDFQADMKTLWSHHGDYRRTDSAAVKGMDPDIDDIINKCDNFDKDFEAMSQETNNSEELEERSRTADFTEQNESETTSLVDRRLSAYEDNHSDTSSPERYGQRQKSRNDSEATFAKPVSAASSRDNSINLSDKQMVSNINREETSPTDSFKTFTSDNYNYVPFDRTHDDEDALSLYAESISGMESSRLDSVASVSNVSLHDVYLPKNSQTSCLREKFTTEYTPTKIQGDSSNLEEESTEVNGIISNNDHQEQEPKTPEDISRACVSSSNFQAMNDKDKTDLRLLEDSNRTSSIAEEFVKRPEAQTWSLPLRPFTTHHRISPKKSSLYRGFCFYFIALQCNRPKCYYRHEEIDSNTFKSRVASLSDDNRIPEYLLMCSYEKLVQKFYILFFRVCIAMKATKIILMMAIDIGFRLVNKTEHLRVEVLETTLLHLNTLDEFEDLFKYERENTMMCDVLLSCMANSQNFAQFKQTFVKLANLICELKRPVDIQVATSILERVCILPGKDFARGMLVLMENTDVSIFENSLASFFENQLWKTDPKLYYVYLSAKTTALESRLAQPDGMRPETLLIPRVTQNIPQQTSPDSTNMDNLPEPLLVSSAPRRFVEPTLPLWRRGGYFMRGTRRHTRNSNRNPPGVYQIQWHHKTSRT